MDLRLRSNKGGKFPSEFHWWGRGVKAVFEGTCRTAGNHPYKILVNIRWIRSNPPPYTKPPLCCNHHTNVYFLWFYIDFVQTFLHLVNEGTFLVKTCFFVKQIIRNASPYFRSWNTGGKSACIHWGSGLQPWFCSWILGILPKTLKFRLVYIFEIFWYNVFYILRSILI